MRPPFPLPRVNPSPETRGSCDPNRLVVYLSVSAGDRVVRPSLSLLGQELVCRRFARHRLHRGIEAEFADGLARPDSVRPPQGNHRPRADRPGFTKLLAHVALCHNRRVVVARLDRLPLLRTARLRPLGARVLSATEPNGRRAAGQEDVLNRIQLDMEELFPHRSAHPLNRKELS